MSIPPARRLLVCSFIVSALLLTVGSASAEPTIDVMTTSRPSGTWRYSPNSRLMPMPGRAKEYRLSDGSTNLRSPNYAQIDMKVDHVEVDGDTVRYYLNAPDDGVVYDQYDYSASGLRARGILRAEGPLVIEATIGSDTAILDGLATVVMNEPRLMSDVRNQGFRYYSAPAGSVVPFMVIYRLVGATWQPDTADAAFSYEAQGIVDFANAVWKPSPTGLTIRGSRTIPSEHSVPYAAVVAYEGGAERILHVDPSWTVAPDAAASVTDGRLVAHASTERVELELYASLEESGVSLEASLAVSVLTDDELDEASKDDWSMTGGDAAHTHFVAKRLEPEDFAVLWQRDLPGVWGEVATAGSRVFLTAGHQSYQNAFIRALDAADGTDLWTVDLANTATVDWPATAHGNVYVVLDDSPLDGTISALRALDAETGELVWDTYATTLNSRYATTLLGGRLYYSAGRNGGIRILDSFTGDLLASNARPESYDWTAAVDAEHAYVYSGSPSYGQVVHVLDGSTGEVLKAVPREPFLPPNGAVQVAPTLDGEGGVFVVFRGVLTRFDVVSNAISWRHDEAYFTGAIAVGGGVLYVLGDGALHAYSSRGGELLWTWRPENGDDLRGDLVATQTHVFVGDNANTYALELETLEAVWSLPERAERLALGSGALYITGVHRLTAIAAPEYIPAALTGFSIEGPTELVEQSDTQLSALASYSNGKVYDRSGKTAWSVEPEDVASISQEGVVSLGELATPETSIIVRASYSEDEVTVQATREFVVRIGVSIDDFVRRNLDEARAIREQVGSQLAEAARREALAKRVLEEIQHGQREGPPSRFGATRVLAELRGVLFWGGVATVANERSAAADAEAIEELDGHDSSAANGWWWWLFGRGR